MSDGLSIALAALLVLLSAFFSSSEAAFLSLQRTRIAHMVSTGVRGAKRVEEMISKPERLLSTILLGNNLVNFAFSSLVTVLIVSLLGEGTGVIVATVVGTTILLLFGEIIPKVLAVRSAERVAFVYAQPLNWVETVLWPVVAVLQWITHRTRDLFGGSSTVRESITEGELRALIDIGEAEGTFAPTEVEMLENVFRFGDRQVREVMTPRNEIISIERGATLREFLDIYAENPHTRFPVYKGELDNIVGIISAKDILKAMATRGIDYADSVTDIIRDAYFVPETKRIAELFDEMRQSGNQMAIAVDEFGGLAGLVTLKGLSEEVVGAVGEEGHGPEEEYRAIDENTYQIEGSMSIDEVREELGVVLPEGDYETIAGFVLDLLGHIPYEGETFEYRNLKFEVTEMRDLKIETIRLTKPETVPPSNETDTGETRRDAAE